MSDKLVEQIRAELRLSRSAMSSVAGEPSGANAAFKLQAKQIELEDLLKEARAARLPTHLILDVLEASRRVDYALVLSVLRGRKDGSIETRQDALERAGWTNAQTRLGRSLADKNKLFPKFPLRTFLSRAQIEGKTPREGISTPSVWLFDEITFEEFERDLVEEFEAALSTARKTLRLTLSGLLKVVVEQQDNEAATVSRVDHVVASNRKVMRNFVTYLQSAEAVLSTVPELSSDLSPAEAKAMLAELRPFHSHFNRIQKLLKNRAEQ